MWNEMPPEVGELFTSFQGDRMLFGSRSMACRPATETFNPASKIGSYIYADTDYDISVEFNQHNIDLLEKAGFVAADDLYSPDDLTRAIFKKDVADSKDTKTVFSQLVPVHVILRVNNCLFMEVWDSIDAEYYYNSLWKRGPGLNRMKKPTAAAKIQGIMNTLYKMSLEERIEMMKGGDVL